MTITQQATTGTRDAATETVAFTRSAGSERGQVLVEFALIIPVLLILVLGIIDFGLGFNAWNTAQNAAREAARVAAVDPNASTIESRARATSSLLTQSNLTVTLNCSTDNGTTFSACPTGASWNEGDIVQVRVAYDYRFVTPLPRFVGLGGGLTQIATAESRFEGQ